jgi:hypothetical protein
MISPLILLAILKNPKIPALVLVKLFDLRNLMIYRAEGDPRKKKSLPSKKST